MDIPAARGMLFELRIEMNHQFTSFRLEVDGRFNQADARFKQIDARLDKVEAKIRKVLAGVYRVALLVEEQNARNIYVFEE